MPSHPPDGKPPENPPLEDSSFSLEFVDDAPADSPANLARTEVFNFADDSAFSSEPPTPPSPGSLARTEVFNISREFPVEPRQSQAKPEVKKIRTSVLGDFRLLAKLGEGGMGTVYRAKRISKPEVVALKVLSKETAALPGFVQRFQREAEIMSRLDHPHIVACLGAGQSHGFHFLAMEYLAGGSVGTWLSKQGRLSLGDSLHIALACARALEYAHGLNLIHRDIKPDNLLLTSDGVVKVADLGLAKAVDDSSIGLTRTGMGIGTPLYAAPEQIRDAKHTDARSDIYALGCVLYHCITGQPPFLGATLIDVIKAKEAGMYVPAQRLGDNVPPGIDRLLMRMLAKVSSERVASCTEVIQEIEVLGLASSPLSFADTSLE